MSEFFNPPKNVPSLSLAFPPILAYGTKVTSPKGVSASKCEMGILLNLNLKQGIKVILYLHIFSSKEEILQN